MILPNIDIKVVEIKYIGPIPSENKLVHVIIVYKGDVINHDRPLLSKYARYFKEK